MQTDWLARGIAIAGLTVALGHLVVNVVIFNWSGGRLRVRISLAKHAYDPLEHRVVVNVTNVGRLPVEVKRLGIRDVVEAHGARPATYLSMELDPSDGRPLPGPLEPGHSLIAEASMPEIIQRWYPNGSVLLRAWAETGSGRIRLSRSLFPLKVKTPPLPKRGAGAAG